MTISLFNYLIISLIWSCGICHHFIELIFFGAPRVIGRNTCYISLKQIHRTKTIVTTLESVIYLKKTSVQTTWTTMIPSKQKFIRNFTPLRIRKLIQSTIDGAVKTHPNKILWKQSAELKAGFESSDLAFLFRLKWAKSVKSKTW